MSSPSAFPKAPLFNIPHLDKWVHAILFGVMAMLFLLGFKRQIPRLHFNNKHYFLALIISTSYGVFIEFVQHFFTLNRHADVYDVMADLIGAALGCIAVYFSLIKGRK
jgi:VanZ family protein